MTLRWVTASASLPATGETANGDQVVIRAQGDDVMVAVVDALGHGPRAAEVAAVAVRYLGGLEWPSATSVDALMDGLHGALHGGRGAAALLLLLRGQEIEACGVGNVDLRCVGVSLPVTLTPGILGARVTRLRVIRGRAAAGCRLFVFSDGLSSRTPFPELALLPPEDACALALRQHRHDRDDASLAVAYLEEVTG